MPQGETPLSLVRTDAVARLAAAGIASADVDAELLIGHVLGLSRGAVQARIVMGAVASAEQAEGILALVDRRAAREPLQHITGRAPFRGLELHVGPGVFVPRPETELLAQLAIDALRADGKPEPIAVDLGTGSGAIALALATEVPHARVFAVELSPEAHAWAARNVAEFGGGNTTLVLGDLGEAFPELDGTVSVVASNPPYVPADAVPEDPEVARHDPALALYGGPSGLDVITALADTAWRLLRAGGLLVIEHAEHQSGPLADLLRARGWHAIAHHADLTGRDRATSAVR
ncbi:peptide chain release factor N(5)-glutamine methyltransferase [Rathayibacter sp. YIM 133350]|uniref:peptide chain release factor N(5)-glutamine methyltransferase n=1 Tax=Rathayibacter sp. YIM 133350 TaxID=3131992 RepID=UPI00307F2F7B